MNKNRHGQVQKNLSLLQSSVPFPSPPGVGLTGSSRFHQEAPEQSKSTAQIPVQNNKGTAESKLKERQLGHWIKKNKEREKEE